MRAVCSVLVPPPRPSSQLRAAGCRARDEDRRELVVVVLAGVDEQLLVALAQRPRDRGRLDELRPVPDDREDPHPAGWPTAAAITSWTRPRPRWVSGPGAAGSATPSIERDGVDLTRRRGEERLLRERQLVGGDRALGDETGLEQAPARDRVEHVVVERRGDERLAVERGDERLARALEHAAVRRDEQRLVPPCSFARRLTSMFAP